MAIPPTGTFNNFTASMTCTATILEEFRNLVKNSEKKISSIEVEKQKGVEVVLEKFNNIAPDLTEEILKIAIENAQEKISKEE